MASKINVQRYGGFGVDYKIQDARNIPGELWWSPRGPDGYGGFNSYVVVASDHGIFLLPDGERVDIVSINGLGEVRWPVMAHDLSFALRLESSGEPLKPCTGPFETVEAMRYFGLITAFCPECGAGMVKGYPTKGDPESGPAAYRCPQRHIAGEPCGICSRRWHEVKLSTPGRPHSHDSWGNGLPEVDEENARLDAMEE